MTKKVVGIALTAMGSLGMIYAAMVYLGATDYASINAWAPFVVAVIFFIAGITIINNLADRSVTGPVDRIERERIERIERDRDIDRDRDTYR